MLKWLTIPVVLLVVFVGIRVFSGSKDASTTNEPRANELTADETRALGIEGDTPQDTIATLVGQVKQLRTELKSALEDNKQRKADNERLRLRDSTIDQRIQTAISTEREQVTSAQQQTQGVLQDLQRRLDSLGSSDNSIELPVGLGLQEGDSLQTGDSKAFDSASLHWVEPHDAGISGGKERRSSSTRAFEFPTSFKSPADSAEEAPDTAASAIDSAARDGAEFAAVKRTFTVPSDATLIGSMAMTALIGRVPVDGVVADPYPFKIVIGPDNLTANGIELPDLAGAVASGTASGDWTLSCVRGQIRSLTFVFQDGTIRTVRTSAADRGSSAADGMQSALGWISDPYGVPCVSGKRLSNAQQYLTSQMLITAAGAGAASLIDSDSGNFSFVNGNGTTLGTVGISANDAMERILAGGVQEMSQWVNKLYGQAFAAVYVPPTAKVAVHIERPLEIDYDTNGRKVNHRTGAINVPDLD